MKSFAIIETGGKQYKVAPGQKIKIEKLEVEPDAAIVFDKVLLKSDGDNLEVGKPYVTGAKIEAMVLRNARERKKIVFRYHSKTRYRKKKGHRQHFTEVEITNIK